MSEHMIFCYSATARADIGYQHNNCVFNKQVTSDRFNEVKEKIQEILNVLKLKLNINNWSSEWKKVTQEQWLLISKIPEFDLEVVEEIIGFKLNLSAKVEIVVDGKSKWISRESAKTLNLID